MANRDGLLRDVRGAAIYVEFLLVVPLLAILWMAANHMHLLGSSHTKVQRQARQCAWVHAAGGCQGKVPEACRMQGPTRLDSPELDAMTGSGLESAMRPVRGLSELFRRQTGDQIAARPTATVTSPLRSELELNGFHSMMCNERPSQLDEAKVMDVACPGLLGQGGRCP